MKRKILVRGSKKIKITEMSPKAECALDRDLSRKFFGLLVK